MKGSSCVGQSVVLNRGLPLPLDHILHRLRAIPLRACERVIKNLLGLRFLLGLKVLRAIPLHICGVILGLLDLRNLLGLRVLLDLRNRVDLRNRLDLRNLMGLKVLLGLRVLRLFLPSLTLGF